MGTALRGSVGQDLGSAGPSQLPLHPLPPPQILALRQARRPVPPEVAQQYQDIMQRSQWQRAQLEQGGPGMRRGRSSGTGVGGGVEATGPILMSPHLHPSEYMAQLERQLQFYTEAARRLGNDGSRVSRAGVGAGPRPPGAAR